MENTELRLNYYIIKIAEGDKSVEGKSIYSYNDKMLALGQFHKLLGTAYASTLYTKYTSLLIDENGIVIISDTFARDTSNEEDEEIEN